VFTASAVIVLRRYSGERLFISYGLLELFIISSQPYSDSDILFLIEDVSREVTDAERKKDLRSEG